MGAAFDDILLLCKPQKGNGFFVIVDAFSNYINIPLQTQLQCHRVPKNALSPHRFLKDLVSDNRRQILSKELVVFCQESDIKARFHQSF